MRSASCLGPRASPWATFDFDDLSPCCLQYTPIVDRSLYRIAHPRLPACFGKTLFTGGLQCGQSHPSAFLADNAAHRIAAVLGPHSRRFKSAEPRFELGGTRRLLGRFLQDTLLMPLSKANLTKRRLRDGALVACAQSNLQRVAARADGPLKSSRRLGLDVYQCCLPVPTR
jgi:hypothetical protein